MGTKPSVRRVGPKSWMLLGAFAQSPGMILDKSEIIKFVIDNRIDADYVYLIRVLVREGFIDRIDGTDRYRMMEYGATVCARTEARQPKYFARLDGGR